MTNFNEDIQITDRELLSQLPDLSDRELIIKYLSKVRYTDLLLAMMPLVEDENQAIRIIELTWEVNKRLAARLAGAAQPQLQAQTVGQLRELIDPFIQGQYQGIYSKIEFLAATNSEFAISDLSDLIFYYQAVQALKIIASQQELGHVAVLAETALINALENPNVRGRETIVEALGYIGSNSAIPLLIRHLQEHPDFSMRMKAATALGKIGNRDAVDVLIVALDDRHEYVRGRAAEALGLLKDDRAIEPLLIALEDRYYGEVRTSAARALGKLGSIRAIEPLIQMLLASELAIRGSSAAALGDLGSDLAVEPLIKALSDEHPQIRKDAAESLGKIGDERAIEVLESKLRDRDIAVSQGAINGLVIIDSDRSIQILFDAFNSHNPGLCDRIAPVLTGSVGERRIELLIDILQNGFYRARGRTAEILGKIGNERATSSLVVASESENYWVRIKAVFSLAKIANNESAKALTKALKDPSRDVRKNATFALTIVGRTRSVNLEKAVDPLIIALQDSSHAVKIRAACALGVIGSERAIASLTDNLQSKYHQIRLSAFYALVEIYGINNELILKLSLQSQFPNVRSAMYYLLPSVDFKIAMAALSNAIEHSNSKVRSDASSFNFFVVFLSQIEAQENFSIALDLAIKGLHHKDKYVCVNIAHSLTRISSKLTLNEGFILVTSVLSEHLCLRDYVKQNIIIKALGVIGRENAVEPLLKILKDNKKYSIYTGDTIVDSLQQIVSRLGRNLSTSQKCLIAEGLIEAIKDESWKGRDRANILLAKIRALD
jgi:HEAT repeat protein